MVIFTKSVHLDVVLDEVQRVSKVWFENFELQGLKVVIRLELADLTIIICEQVLYLESI